MPNSPRHLVVSITGHGFGHVAQTAPILNALHGRIPDLRITVRSSVPLPHLRSRIRVPFDYLQSDGDTGMVMSSALDVHTEDSYALYRDFHACWDARVDEEADLLRELGADMVYSNVGYLPLAGAQRAGIPNVALCSLNWADIYRHYCGDGAIAAQIRQCYANAEAFLRATPGMAMSDLPNLLPVAPIAAIGNNRREELGRHLRLAPEEKMVLVSMGGIASRLPVERWPRMAGVRWLVQQSWRVQHPDAIDIESLPWNFSDLLASCDVLLCKPGYGSFVEAVCSGTPVLYVDRPGWPEAPILVEWLRKHGVGREVTRQSLEQGSFASELQSILGERQIERIVPEGAGQVSAWLAGKLE